MSDEADEITNFVDDGISIYSIFDKKTPVASIPEDILHKSPVFNAMLSIGMREQQERKICIHASFEAFHLLCSFILWGCPIDKDFLSNVDLFEVWELVDMYDLPWIHEWIWYHCVNAACIKDVTLFAMKRDDELFTRCLKREEILDLDEILEEDMVYMTKESAISLLEAYTKKKPDLYPQHRQVANRAKFLFISRWMNVHQNVSDAAWMLDKHVLLAYVGKDFMLDKVFPSGIVEKEFSLKLNNFYFEEHEMYKVHFMDKVSKVQEHIKETLSIYHSHIRLLYNGKILEDDEVIGGYGLVEGKRIVYLILRPNGNPYKEVKFPRRNPKRLVRSKK